MLLKPHLALTKSARAGIAGRGVSKHSEVTALPFRRCWKQSVAIYRCVFFAAEDASVALSYISVNLTDELSMKLRFKVTRTFSSLVGSTREESCSNIL